MLALTNPQFPQKAKEVHTCRCTLYPLLHSPIGEARSLQVLQRAEETPPIPPSVQALTLHFFCVLFDRTQRCCRSGISFCLENLPTNSYRRGWGEWYCTKGTQGGSLFERGGRGEWDAAPGREDVQNTPARTFGKAEKGEGGRGGGRLIDGAGLSALMLWLRGQDMPPWRCRGQNMLEKWWRENSESSADFSLRWDWDEIEPAGFGGNWMTPSSKVCGLLRLFVCLWCACGFAWVA